ncbi:oxidoreductase [Macrococcus capreoli]
MIDIAIIGAGAVGSIILHLIKDSHFQIDIFATEIRDINIEKDGVILPTGFTTKTLTKANKQYDIIFITTKAFMIDRIMPNIESMIHEDTKIIICQNGYSQNERFQHSIVFHAAVYISGQKMQDKVIYFRDNKLVLPINPHTQTIQNAFKDTQLNIILAEDYLSQIWFKLLVNLGINSMTALTQNTAQIQKVPEIQQLIIQLLKEGVMVANAESQHFNDTTIDQILSIYAGYPDHMGTSMYYDMLNQSPTEYEFIQGYIYERARYHHLATPTLDIIYAILKGYQFSRI